MATLEGDLLYFIETFGQYEIEEEDGVDVKYYVKNDNCLGMPHYNSNLVPSLIFSFNQRFLSLFAQG
jgi:hypothetical protein